MATTAFPPSSSASTRALLICHGDAQGQVLIYGYDPLTGGLTARAGGAMGASSSFGAWHPDPSLRVIYATHNRTDQLGAFAFDDRSRFSPLRPLNKVGVPAATPGASAGPAYVSVDSRGRFLLAANYRGHNVVVFALLPDGRIGPLLCSVSDGKHAHLVRLAPGDDRFAFVPYLGTDIIGQYSLDPVTGVLAPNDPPSVVTPAGAGPRHLEFHPFPDRDGRRHVFVINELDASLAAYVLHPASGTMTERCRVDSLPPGYSGQRWAAHVAVSPSGRFVYVCNRAHDSLAVFAWDPDGPALTPVQHLSCRGKTPRHFILDPTGRFLLCANQDSGNVAVFAVDAGSGRLTPQSVHPVGGSPYFLTLAPPMGPSVPKFGFVP